MRSHPTLEGNILNLSNLELSKEQCEVLSHGLKFVPTPCNDTNIEKMENCMEIWAKKVKRQYFFNKKAKKGSQPKKAIPFCIQSDWEPAPSQIPESLEEELQKIIMSVRKIDPAPPTGKNLTKAQYKALRHLERIKQKVKQIRKADKGSVVVLQNRSDYVMEAERQLLDTKYFTKKSTHPSLRKQRKCSQNSYWIYLKYQGRLARKAVQL